MVWYENLYIGKKCAYKINRLKFKIVHRQIHPTVYLIVLPQQEHTLLEIVPSTLLMQRAYPSDDMRVIAIASDRQEALQMTAEILELVYKEQHDFDVASYLNGSWQQMKGRGGQKI